MNAFFCWTPVHIFRALHLQMNAFKNVKADLYIFNVFMDSYNKVKEIVRSGVFENVYLIEKNSFYVKSTWDCVCRLLYKSQFKKILKTKIYNKLFFFNVSIVMNTIAYKILLKNNPQLELNYVEDAPLLYPMKDTVMSNRYRMFCKILGYKDPGLYVVNWWMSNPDVAHYSGRAEKKRLPTVKKSDEKFKKIVNEVFDYQPLSALEKADIIIMEESFHQDGLIQNQDLDLFKYICGKLSHKNVLVKMHPRSQNMRFSDKFQVLEKTSIPWEIYCLNTEIENKTIIALSCATLISANLLYGDEPKVIMLYKLLKNDIKKLNGDLYFTEEWESSLADLKKCYQNQERFQIVESMPELDKLLEQMNHEK